MSRAVLVLPVALVTAGALSSPAAVAGVRTPCPAGVRTCVLDQPGTYRYVVPAGVQQLRIAVSGAEGGSRGGSLGDYLAAGVPERFGAGGPGGRIDADVAVRPGQRLIVVIGRMGAPGEIARYNDPSFAAPATPQQMAPGAASEGCGVGAAPPSVSEAPLARGTSAFGGSGGGGGGQYGGGHGGAIVGAVNDNCGPHPLYAGLPGGPGGGGSGYADPAWCSDVHPQKTGTHHGDGLVVITPR